MRPFLQSLRSSNRSSSSISAAEDNEENIEKSLVRQGELAYFTSLELLDWIGLDWVGLDRIIDENHHHKYKQ